MRNFLRNHQKVDIFFAFGEPKLDSSDHSAMETMSGAVKQDARPLGRGIGGLLAWSVGSGAMFK